MMAVTPSGKDKIQTGIRLYVGGYDLSGDARTFSSLDNAHETADMTGHSNNLMNFLADSRTAGVMGYQCIMNDATGRAWDRLQTPGSNTGSQIAVLFGGAGADPAVGDPGYHLGSIQSNAPVSLDGRTLVLQSDFIPDGGQMDSNVDNPAGVVLRGPTSLSATLTGSSANSVDNDVSTAAGWTAVIHILATSSGNFALKVRHSSDDSAWADLGTFTTTGGAVGSELLTGSGTVNQYVAFDATRTAGTITAVLTFARN